MRAAGLLVGVLVLAACGGTGDAGAPQAAAEAAAAAGTGTEAAPRTAAPGDLAGAEAAADSAPLDAASQAEGIARGSEPASEATSSSPPTSTPGSTPGSEPGETARSAGTQAAEPDLPSGISHGGGRAQADGVERDRSHELEQDRRDGVERERADTTTAARPVFTRPERIRGIYLNAWASGSRTRTEALIELARRTEINTFVIDVKDDTGYLSYPTKVELAREVGADKELRILDVQGLLRRLEAEGIYPIARIVVFKDHLLAERRPDLAVQDSAGGAWVDGRGDVWVNPYDERVWAYHAEIAREAAELGFPEIQWDYVRFPDRPASELERAVFPGRGERTRSRAIRGFLIWAGEALDDLDLPLTADVFGMATSARSDVGIGQLWEDFIDVVDAALPMVYPSHYYPGSFGLDEPNAHPYELIRDALGHATRRNQLVENPGRIIPWLQDFTLGSPAYSAAEVRAQILATYDAGIEEWILWNSAGRYTEEALEPAGGWPGGLEPPIRFGGEIVPAAVRLLEAEPKVVAPEPDVRDRSGRGGQGSASGDTASAHRGR